MLRGGPRTSVQDSSNLQQRLLQDQDQQKQKKRLSFRDPEVEGPQRNNYYFGGGKSKTLARPTSARPKVPITRKLSSSFEDLTLEEQEFHHSGNALSDGNRRNFFEIEAKETDIIDGSPTQDFQDYRYQNSPEDSDYLEPWASPQADELDMRLPTESEELMENDIPARSPPQEAARWSSGSSEQHQIQMLRYQLEQQHQQTQMALHQIQLLHDQLSAESNARNKAQEQNNELMNQNTELLNHMEKLFLQIEELERQVQQLEQEKRGRRTVHSPKSPVPSLRQPMSYTAHRRQSTEQALQSRMQNAAPKSPEPEKTPVPIRSSYTAARRSSLTLNKPLAAMSKPSTTQNSSQYTALSTVRKAAAGSSKTSNNPSKKAETSDRPKDSLRIGDSSPPAVATKSSPFNSLWKSKLTLSQSSVEKPSATAVDKTRASSASSFGKNLQEASAAKTSLFSGGSSLSVTGAKSKKYSSSTSDLYLTTAESKSSLLVEEPASPKVRNAVSNLSINSSLASTASRLPRYQPYTGWQRRTSLTTDTESVSGLGKEPFKNTSSLFKR